MRSTLILVLILISFGCTKKHLVYRPIDDPDDRLRKAGVAKILFPNTASQTSVLIRILGLSYSTGLKKDVLIVRYSIENHGPDILTFDTSKQSIQFMGEEEKFSGLISKDEQLIAISPGPSQTVDVFFPFSLENKRKEKIKVVNLNGSVGLQNNKDFSFQRTFAQSIVTVDQLHSNVSNKKPDAYTGSDYIGILPAALGALQQGALYRPYPDER
jgi:hypothetical protein